MTSAVLSLGSSIRRIDGVVAAIAAILLGLAIVLPPQAVSTVRFTASSLLEVAPFLVLSVAIAAYAKATGAENLIARAFSGRTGMMILFAALMGALSPFCSCGVIPLIAAMLSMGVPLPAVMAFWLASPIMDPSMFVLTAGTLGMDFAIYKTFAAVAIGLFGGFGVMALSSTRLFANPLRPGIGDGGCGASSIRTPGVIRWQFWGEEARRASFAKSARTNMLFLGKWLALAFVLESLMLAYVPADMIAANLGGEGWLPILTATFVGIPAYLNGYAALPLIGGLIEQGMTPAAGMAFLLAGGVTSIPAAIAVFALARLPVFLSYIGFALVGVLALAAVYRLVG
ncbi:MAG: permease [Rhodospirillaceae bacterium]